LLRLPRESLYVAPASPVGASENAASARRMNRPAGKRNSAADFFTGSFGLARTGGPETALQRNRPSAKNPYPVLR
jgi:hypothetical protein